MSAPARLHVALIGAGGLGGPIAYALARAGVQLSIYDHDLVELSNLQRQVQFRTEDIGRPKVQALADELVRRGHERARVRTIPVRFTADSAVDVIDNVDLMVDGSDDFATKFEVNDQAMRAGIPFVIASVVRYSGQVFAHDPRPWPRPWPRPRPQSMTSSSTQGAPAGCYRCLFEEPPTPGSGDDQGQTCADGGVLGAAVGLIGGVAARAALALMHPSYPAALAPVLADADADTAARAPAGGLWVFDDVRAPERVRRVRFAPRRTCRACVSTPFAHLQKEAS